MVDILQRVGIGATPAQVYDSLTTLDGLGQWWTRDVSGDPTPGGKITCTFVVDPDPIGGDIEASPDRRVAWRCISGPDEWLDTLFTFDIDATDDETVMRFAHAGWREPVEFMGHCTTKWAYFLLGMKSGLEGGQATPFPGDLQLSRWG